MTTHNISYNESYTDDESSILTDLLDDAIEHASTEWEKTFVASVEQFFSRNGYLTSKQVDVLRRIGDRAVTPPVVEPRREQPLDLSGIPSGLYAVPGGDTRLKVRIDVVTSGKWANWVFVKDAAVYGEGKKYGSQKPGQAYRGEIVEQLRAIVSDPLEASKAYGRLTSTCGVCGRALENEESVANGIGPVCRSKFGN